MKKAASQEEERAVDTKLHTPLREMADDEPPDDEVNVKKKRGDRGSKRKTKTEEAFEIKEEQYYQVGMDSKYDVWVPPSNQSGDGKTSLNEKLGY